MVQKGSGDSLFWGIILGLIEVVDKREMMAVHSKSWTMDRMFLGLKIKLIIFRLCMGYPVGISRSVG